jgi:hypothetical protein
MGRYKNQLAGLSLPINLFSVLLHILAVFTIIFSQLRFLNDYEMILLWISFPCLAVSLCLIFMFKGYYLLVQHARLSAGFMLLILSLIHITALHDFGMFLNAYTAGENNPLSFLSGNNVLAGTLAVIEFVAAIALIIGAWIRPFSILLVVLFGMYSVLFFNQHPFGDMASTAVSYSFGLDQYLLSEMNLETAFTFCIFLTVISLVGALFGHKTQANSVQLNWIIIPVYTVLAVGLAIVLHWYPLIFIVPLTILICLITFRSGGRYFGNHFGALVMALLMALFLVFLQDQTGISRKNTTSISTNK